LSQIAWVPRQMIAPQADEPVLGIVEDTVESDKFTLRDTLDLSHVQIFYCGHMSGMALLQYLQLSNQNLYGTTNKFFTITLPIPNLLISFVTMI